MMVVRHTGLARVYGLACDPISASRATDGCASLDTKVVWITRNPKHIDQAPNIVLMPHNLAKLVQVGILELDLTLKNAKKVQIPVPFFPGFFTDSLGKLVGASDRIEIFLIEAQESVKKLLRTQKCVFVNF